jgi:ABC-type uncharacterized transport system fused permease/ATPase subunit
VSVCCYLPQGEIFFVPQRPYVVLGTLRDQLLYPTWAKPQGGETPAAPGAASDGAAAHAASPSSNGSNGSGNNGSSAAQPRPLPGDERLQEVLREVQLGPLLERVGGDLDSVADWASTLSLGEQQRLAFARVLLARVRPTALLGCCPGCPPPPGACRQQLTPCQHAEPTLLGPGFQLFPARLSTAGAGF